MCDKDYFCSESFGFFTRRFFIGADERGHENRTIDCFGQQGFGYLRFYCIESLSLIFTIVLSGFRNRNRLP